MGRGYYTHRPDPTPEERTSVNRGSHCFRPFERLRSSDAYLRARKKGKRVRTPHFFVNFVPNDMSCHRLGLVVQKRHWNHAATRNRIKRCLREWFRHAKDHIPLPYKDIVVVAGPGAEQLSPEAITRELSPILVGRNGCRP